MDELSRPSKQTKGGGEKMSGFVFISFSRRGVSSLRGVVRSTEELSADGSTDLSTHTHINTLRSLHGLTRCPMTRTHVCVSVCVSSAIKSLVQSDRSVISGRLHTHS